MSLFKKDPIERLDEDELREMYLHSRKVERGMSIFYMVLSGLATIAIISYAISQNMYWVLSFSIISVIAFIYCITEFSRVIEDIFENRIIKVEVESGEEIPS